MFNFIYSRARKPQRTTSKAKLPEDAGKAMRGGPLRMASKGGCQNSALCSCESQQSWNHAQINAANDQQSFGLGLYRSQADMLPPFLIVLRRGVLELTMHVCVPGLRQQVVARVPVLFLATHLVASTLVPHPPTPHLALHGIPLRLVRLGCDMLVDDHLRIRVEYIPGSCCCSAFCAGCAGCAGAGACCCCCWRCRALSAYKKSAPLLLCSNFSLLQSYTFLSLFCPNASVFAWNSATSSARVAFAIILH